MLEKDEKKNINYKIDLIIKLLYTQLLQK